MIAVATALLVGCGFTFTATYASAAERIVAQFDERLPYFETNCEVPAEGRVLARDVRIGDRIRGTLDPPVNGVGFSSVYLIATDPNQPGADIADTVGERSPVTFDVTVSVAGTLTGCSYATDDAPRVVGTVTRDDEEDRDKDGVPDRSDRCPAEPGPPDRSGCPDLKPVADVKVTTSTNGSDPVYRFDASGSRDPDGGTLTYEWRFGDGVVDRTSGPIVSHSYPPAGQFTPSLQITDDEGNSVIWVGPEIRRTDRYTVTLRAWIPQAAVVDPQNPVDDVRAVGLREYCTPREYKPGYLRSSRFDGNGHTGYTGGGSNPVKGEVSITFDWDGQRITRIGGLGQAVGPTTRTVVYTDLQGRPTTCRQTGQAGITVDGAAAGSVFRIRFATSNPLTPANVTPPIDAQLSGQFVDGRLVLDTRTDTFPSHGFEVRRNSAIVTQQVVYNAACLDVLGPLGFARITAGLNWYRGTQTQGGYFIRRIVDPKAPRTDYTAPCSRI